MKAKESPEINEGTRFAFGANWTRFLNCLDGHRIQRAEESIGDMLEVGSLEGLRFLDAGSGSGLSSLAARRLGATVHSFDFDPQSVACTEELKRRYHPDDPLWTIEQGSVLDREYISSIAKFDIVYSWGVLHHTGDLRQAMENITQPVKSGGQLFIAIYNDQGYISKRWSRIKLAYNNISWLRPFLLGYGFLHAWGMQSIIDLCKFKPFSSWCAYSNERGMSPWWDIVDWIGGWPFEVATPEKVFVFYRDRNFRLKNMVTRQGYGCNEFVFLKGEI